MYKKWKFQKYLKEANNNKNGEIVIPYGEESDSQDAEDNTAESIVEQDTTTTVEDIESNVADTSNDIVTDTPAVEDIESNNTEVKLTMNESDAIINDPVAEDTESDVVDTSNNTVTDNPAVEDLEPNNTVTDNTAAEDTVDASVEKNKESVEKKKESKKKSTKSE